MRLSATQCLLPAVLPLVAGFPLELMAKFQNDPQMQARARGLIAGKRQTGADAATGVFEAIPTFNAAQQYIDVSEGSGHEWQAPGENDLRGPCPGLNAFANHGFLPRNGWATIDQYINVTSEVVGMGVDLAAFLSILGGLLDSGDGEGWSMGGPDPPGTNSLLGQQGTGLVGSHNKYENDVSPTRPDLYESGNNYITQASQFQDLINASPGGFVTLDNLMEYRSQRYARQLADNPYFFNGPFTGLLVQPAAFSFIFRFMANHSEEEPVGSLSYSTIQSWFGIDGENGDYSAPFGYERIPDNWYRRSLAAPYSIPYFLGDVINAAILHPEFLSIGGNVGEKGNNFVGVDLTNLSSGVFNAAELLQGNNLGCFAFQVAAQVKSDFILADVLNRLTNTVGDIVTSLSCPKLESIDNAQLEQYPGYDKAAVVYGKNKLRRRQIGELQ